MFGYCTEVLHLSEYAAYLRIAVARAARTHPVLLEMLRDGRLHLTAIRHIAPLLLDAVDDAKREEILRCATHKSKREIEELVARLRPQPDAPTSIRKLPKRRKRCSPETGSELGPDPVGRPSRSVPSHAQDEAEQVTTPPSAPAEKLERVEARCLGKVKSRAKGIAAARISQVSSVLRAKRSEPSNDAAILDKFRYLWRGPLDGEELPRRDRFQIQ